MDWLQYIDTLRAEHPSLYIRQSDELLPQFVLKQLSDITEGSAIIVTGVGQHQMWAAQHYAYREPNSLLTSGGLGAMGFEVPAALGAKVGRPDKVVWSIAGDGGFQMTMCDLATAVENNIDVKFAILNNGTLGMVRQWQDFFYDKDFFATVYSGNPGLCEAGRCLRHYRHPRHRQDPGGGRIRQAMDTPGPVVVDFIVKQDEQVYPMIPAGESVNEMMEEPIPERIF